MEPLSERRNIMAQEVEVGVIEKHKHDLGQMEAVLGADSTIDSLVNDILEHYHFLKNILTKPSYLVKYQ